jgi:hypothetical protein
MITKTFFTAKDFYLIGTKIFRDHAIDQPFPSGGAVGGLLGPTSATRHWLMVIFRSARRLGEQSDSQAAGRLGWLGVGRCAGGGLGGETVAGEAVEGEKVPGPNPPPS